MRRPRLLGRLVGCLAGCLVAAGCSDGGEDRLSRLPIEGGTAAPPTLDGAAAGADPTSGATTPGGLPAPTARPSAGPDGLTPVGDWDGARFDAGVIVGVSSLGTHTTIELDRWSYTGPDGRTLDAAGFDAEPVAAWWRENPFSNVQVQTRTFVLAPDVAVQRLDPAGRTAACVDPPPASAPAPRWLAAPPAALADPDAADDIAVLTYDDTGLVTRVRLTHGC